MAKWMSLCFLVVCVVLIILICGVDDSDARGGRGGGSRGGSRSSWGSRTRYSSSRYRTSTRIRQRIRQRVRYSSTSRMYKGSYGLTRSSWKSAFLLGSIYGGARYLRSPRYHRYPNRMPTICRNSYETDDNGTTYNRFYCPRFFEPDDYEYCCGDADKEYCCKYFDSPGRTAGIVIGVLVAVVIIGVIVYCVCKKTGTAGKVFKSSKPSTQYAIRSPAPTMAYSAPKPVQPMDQPLNQPGYPDAAYTAGNDKPTLPPGDINQGGMPYPTNPTPYPPGPDGGMPPPQGAMYPPPQGYPAAPGYQPVGPPPPGEFAAPPPGSYPPPAGYPPPGSGYPPPGSGYPPPGAGYPAQPPPAYGQ